MRVSPHKIERLLGKLTPAGSGHSGTALVARQPIFDRAGNISAYELLFRDPSLKPGLGGRSSHAATSTVIMDGLDLMLPSLRKGQRFFINFTAEMLEAELASILPAHTCVIEILEDAQATPSLLRGLRNLKKQGYVLALDDFVGQPRLLPFLHEVDIVKVDVLGQSRKHLEHLVTALSRYKVRLLAEKVEDNETAKVCRELGFTYFQGFFFSRAEIVQGKKLSPSQITKTRLLTLSTREIEELSELITVISADVYLSFKLLKYVNSVYFGLPMQVRSVEHAILMLGQLKMRQWLCVTALADMDAAPMSREIVYISALRAKFLERLASRHRVTSRSGKGKHIPDNLFLVGLFSLLESILHIPMGDIFSSLSMEEDIVSALQDNSGPYASWLNLLEAYERGDWERTRSYSSQLKLSSFDLTDAYAEAIRWSSALFGA